MTLHKFLRSLSAAERDSLALSVGKSAGYFRLLSSDENRLASIDLANSIQLSQLNQSLHEKMQFSSNACYTHRKLVTARKNIKESV